MVKVTKIVLVALAVIAIAAAAPDATATESVIDDEKPSCVSFSIDPFGVAVDPGCVEGGVPPPPSA